MGLNQGAHTHTSQALGQARCLHGWALGRKSSHPPFLLWKLYGKFAKAVLSIHAIFDSRDWNSVKRYFAKCLYYWTEKKKNDTKNMQRLEEGSDLFPIKVSHFFLKISQCTQMSLEVSSCRKNIGKAVICSHPICASPTGGKKPCLGRFRTAIIQKRTTFQLFYLSQNTVASIRSQFDHKHQLPKEKLNSLGLTKFVMNFEQGISLIKPLEFMRDCAALHNESLPWVQCARLPWRCWTLFFCLAEPGGVV